MASCSSSQLPPRMKDPPSLLSPYFPPAETWCRFCYVAPLWRRSGLRESRIQTYHLSKLLLHRRNAVRKLRHLLFQATPRSTARRAPYAGGFSSASSEESFFPLFPGGSTTGQGRVPAENLDQCYGRSQAGRGCLGFRIRSQATSKLQSRITAEAYNLNIEVSVVLPENAVLIFEGFNLLSQVGPFAAPQSLYKGCAPFL